MKTNGYSFTSFLFAALVLFALINSGCSKIDDVTNPQMPKETFTIEQKNANIELLGQVIAKLTSQSKEFRLLVWGKAQEKVTHDYDVPLVFILDEIIGETTVRVAASSILSAIDPDSKLEKLIESLHYVELTIPLHQVEGWNPLLVPSIAIVPVEPQENVENYLGFNPTCERVQFSSKDAPKEPVIVIRESDRIDKNGKLSVNMDGLTVPEEARLHIDEFKENIKELILMREEVNSKKEKFFNIISEEAYQQMVMQQKAEQESLQKKQEAEHKLFLAEIEKATSSKSLVSNSLTGFTNQRKAVTLSWSDVPQSGVIYKVIASGDFIVNGYQQFVTDQLLTTTTSLNATCLLPYEGQIYNIWVEGFSNSSGEKISCSNPISIHSSGRASACTEYPNKISMTASAMRNLEGWAANDLELNWVISKSNTSGVAERVESDKDFDGGHIYYPHYSWGRMRDTDRNYTSSSFPLFDWNRTDFYNNGERCNNGTYSILWIEHDGDLKDKTIQIATNIIRLAGNIYNPVLTEAVFSILELSFSMYKHNEEIGTCYVDWWSLQAKRTLPMVGVVIDISYTNK